MGCWATQIGRMQYIAGATIDYTSIPRLSALHRANKDGKAFDGTGVKRVDAAMSSDGKTLFIWAKCDTEMQFAFYRTSALNSIFDTLENQSSKYISCGSENVKAACKNSFNSIGKAISLPNGSFQGCEIDDSGNIYIIGGSKYDTPKIRKISYNGNVLKTVAITGTENNPQFVGDAEIEGIQLLGDYLYFVNYNPNYPAGSAGEVQYIYSIPVSYMN